MSMNRFEKSTLPSSRPMGGKIMPSTSDVTILPNAAPIMTATARSITLPRAMNSLNSLNMLPPHFDCQLPIDKCRLDTTRSYADAEISISQLAIANRQSAMTLMAVLCEFESGLFCFIRGFENHLVCCCDLFLRATGTKVISLGFLVCDDRLRFFSSFRLAVSGFGHRVLLFFLLPSYRDGFFSGNIKDSQAWSTSDHRHDQLEIVAAHLLTARSPRTPARGQL